MMDVESGKALSDPVRHELDIVEIHLSQSGLISDRKIIFIDKNRDLFIAQIHKPSNFKLATMVDSAIWHDSTDVLCAVSDGKLLVWYYPNVVYIDRDLVQASRFQQDASSFGKSSSIISFSESRVTVRRADGALQVAAVSPYPFLLYKFVAQTQWPRCTRLCRFIKDEVLWAVLAVMAINGQQLDVAEVALAAIDEVDKLQYIQFIKSIPSAEGRSAELLLYRRQPDQTEAMLLQSDLVYRAIQLNVNIFRWQRALDLAIKYKTHVDTVLAFRQKYLQSMARDEADERFIKYTKEVPIDWQSINAKIDQDLKKEESRGTPYRSQLNLQDFSKLATNRTPMPLESGFGSSTGMTMIGSSPPGSGMSGMALPIGNPSTGSSMVDDVGSADDGEPNL